MFACIANKRRIDIVSISALDSAILWVDVIFVYLRLSAFFNVLMGNGPDPGLVTT
jgi:hypothetical protein